MNNGIDTKKYGSSDNLLSFLLTNNFLTKEGDIVDKIKFIEWLEENGKKESNIQNLTRGDIYSLISKMINDQILIENFSENKYWLIATNRYNSLKNSELFVRFDGKKYDVFDGSKKISTTTNIQKITPILDNKEAKPFYEWYLDNFNSKNLSDDDFLQYLPQFLNLLTNLLTKPETDFRIKVLCSLALSYLVIEDDYYPDSQQNGYLDDMFIVTYALKQIIDKDSDLLKKNWAYDEDITFLIQNIYDQLHEIVKNDLYPILTVVGMDQYSLYNIDKIQDCLLKNKAN